MIDPVQIEEWLQKLPKCGCGRVGRYETSTGLACNKYVRCDNAEFLAEQIKQLQTQLESEKVSHAAWEKQSLLEYSEIVQERDALRYEWEAACTLVAEMHKAAVGDYQGCTNGVVEDIADLKADRDALRDALVTIGDASQAAASFRDLQIFARKALAKLKEE